MTHTFALAIAGDTSLGEYYLNKPKWKRIQERLANEPYSFFDNVSPLIHEDDFLILNFESVFLESAGTPIEGKQYPNWDLPGKTIPVFKKLGVNAVTLANNHALDFGEQAFLYTKELFDKNGIETIGAGNSTSEASKPLELVLKGNVSEQKIYIFTGMRASRRYKEDYGFFAKKKKPGVNSMGLKRMKKKITNIRTKDPNSIIIIIPHWQGIDYKWASESEKIVQSCKDLLDSGADYIIGHGTHMANNIESSNNGLIAYSIGNFVFNSPGRYKSMQAPPYSFITKLDFRERKGKWETKIKFYPIFTDNKKTDFHVRPVNEDEIRQCIFYLANKPNDSKTIYHKYQDDSGFYYITCSL